MNHTPSLKGRASGRGRKILGFRTRMLLCFGLTFVFGFFADNMLSLYGIPFTSYQGEYGFRRTEAFRDLGIFADSKKTEFLHLIAERRSDAGIFCESPVFRKLVTRVTGLAHTGGSAAGGVSGRNAVLTRNDDYQALLGHLEITRQTYQSLYEKISLVDARSGTIIASTDRRDVGTDLSASVSIREAREMVENENIDVQRDPRSGKPYLSISHAVRSVATADSEDEAVIAVLILYLDPDVIIKSLKAGEEELGNTGEIVLVTEDLQILTALKYPLPDGTVPRPLEFRLETKAAMLAAEGSEGVIAARDYREVPILAAFRHLRLNSETGWGMVVKKDQAEVFAPIRQLLYMVALKGAVLCLLIIGLTMIITFKLAGPVKELIRTARRVEAGDLSARASVKETDEIGLLADSFNSMVQRIQHWRDELDTEVRNRTTELEDVNAALKCEIDERSRAEAALSVSERRFRELLETVQLIAVILDREGNITFCNDFLLRLTGWDRDELLGRNWFDLFIPEESRQTVKTVFNEAHATAQVAAHFENMIVTRSGVRRVIIWDNTILQNPDGTLAGVASLGTDVTEQRSLEDLLRHSQKMEAVGQLAGGVAHDFNNLLTAIIGNCELIKLKMGPDTQMSGHLEQILLVSAKAARLVQSLLAFSRKQLLRTAVVDINDCVRAVENLLVRSIGEDIDVRLVLTETKLPARADCDQLEQVLVNLATNARDAMPGGGELLIETRLTCLDQLAAKVHGLDKEGAYAIIQVTDTGSGMDEAVREKIFDPFFTTKEVGKGTGLGLAMVFGTIRQHGGVIDVDSEVGRGTVFRIYLPVIQEEPAGEEEAVPEETVPGGAETVLVVEDNHDVRKVTALILETQGYRVIEAANGEEAIARFTEHRDAVRLVILDVIMPKMSGKDVYDAIRKISPDVRALFISGYTADILSRKVMLEEGLRFLQKPVPPRELLSMVRQLLDRG